MSFDFFAATLPEEGFYCIGLLRTNGSFQHRFFDDKQKAYDYAVHQDTKGETVYYGQASFKENSNRKGENAQAVRSFWLDIDCGPEKPFKTQAEGIKALGEFVNSTSLPAPAVVNSGTGLYAYWLLDTHITPQQWYSVAAIIKDLCAKLDFAVDPVRTADKSSVLRPVGATNRKNGDRTVKLLRSMEPVSFADFSAAVKAAAEKHKVSLKTLAPPETQINSEFQIEMQGEKPSGRKIAEKCNQVRQVRDTQGNVSEPLWYAAIGLLKSTVEGDEVIHEWSQGHPDYDWAETARKIEQHRVNATTCAHFFSVNAEGCAGCRYHGKINSPWRLGLPEPKRIEVPEAEGFALPRGFARTDRGIVYGVGMDSDELEEIIHVFPYDIYPTKLAQDETIGQEILHLKAKDPHVGWFDVQMRTALLHDHKALLMVLADQGVHPYHGKNERALFMALLSGYMQQLKDNRRKIVLAQQMGWFAEPEGRQAFVLGSKVISDRGIEDAGIAKCADTVVKAIEAVGSREVWAETTAILDKEGLEPWAFTLAALGFGAPLMHWTGYKGSMLSMVGKSGIGKTAMGWWALSVWGNPEKLQMIQRDTHNATVARMALYNNLPLFIDEITNIKEDVLSDLAYQITQGRDKHTLTRSRTERSALSWATIGAASSNKSLVDILGGYKIDPSAEINRIFEYEFPSGIQFDGVTAYRMFTKNYGVAGEVYAQYLTMNQESHHANLLRIQGMIELEADCRPEERFWAVTAACALYGATIAKHLGLFNVDIQRLKAWIIQAIRKMRGVRDDTVVDTTSWIGTFLSKYAANMLVVERMKDNVYRVMMAPKGPLYIRKDHTTNRLWVSRDLIKRELVAGSANFSKMRLELLTSRALVNDKTKIVLGRGTEYQGVAEICWELDLNNPTMGYSAVQLVRAAEVSEVVNG